MFTESTAALGIANKHIPKDAILNVQYPEHGQLRARKVISRSKARATGKYPSWKMNRMVHWESPNELNAFRLLDANASVTEFVEQPAVVTYVMDGVERKHYPDIKVVMGSAKALWEVKTRADALDPETARRTELMTVGLPRYGYAYHVAIADDFKKTPSLANALILLRLGRTDIPIVERERLRRKFAEVQHLTWGLIKGGALGSMGKAYACRLILEGALRFNMDAPLVDTTVISATSDGGCSTRSAS